MKTFLFKNSVLRLNYRGRSHEPKAVEKAKLVFYVNCFTFFVDERANNDIFAETDVFFLIIWNAFDVFFGFAEIFNE